MNMNCRIADDLLPLYVDGVCSPDSRALLEEHLRTCPACREKLKRMGQDTPSAPVEEMASANPLAACARKIQRRRLRTAVLATLSCVVGACFLALCLLAIHSMRLQANPTVFPVEEGVYNLTAGELKTTAGEAGEYVLFTNSTRIAVTAAEGSGFSGEILLWDVGNDSAPILYGHVDGSDNTCVFENLTSARYYRVTCEGEADLPLTISEGRIISFWYSLGEIINTLLGR